jgi:hypothetical protein
VVAGAGGGTVVLWWPTGPEQLALFNRHIVGRIEVVHEFHAASGEERV